jgi:hypothetical protein
MTGKEIARIAVAIAFAVAVIVQATAARGDGVRAEPLGWQYEDFSDNVNLTFSPASPTPMEPVVIKAVSKNPQVHIQVAYAYLTVQLLNSGPVTTGLTFSRVNETVMTCTLSAYPNGTLVRFYVNVLDFFNTPAISGNNSYTVMGQDRPGGWMHSEFEKNLNLTWSPYVPNATEPTTVTIVSKEGVAIYGAYLYLTYEVKPGQPQSGGYPFVRLNQTAMGCEVPGYPMGTAVRFWVSAWDKYNNLSISSYYNYTVLKEEDYTNHEFVPFDGLAVVGGMVAFAAVGSFAYLRVLGTERRRRAKGTQYGKSEGAKPDAEAAAAPDQEKGQEKPKPTASDDAKGGRPKPSKGGAK